MTQEEYWNVYEKYNAERILLFGKLYNLIVDQGIKKGELKKADKMTVEVQNEYKKYFDSVIHQYVKNAEISFSEKYRDVFKNFKID
jgi:hypothetical protein